MTKEVIPFPAQKLVKPSPKSENPTHSSGISQKPKEYNGVMKKKYFGADFKWHTKERFVVDSPDTLRCPKCQSEYDEEILGSTVCPRDGATLRRKKNHYTLHDQ